MRVSIGLPVADWRACATVARQAEADGADAVTRRATIAAIQRIPSGFVGFHTGDPAAGGRPVITR